MMVLPNADMAVIPIEKLTHYSLNFIKDPDKARVFSIALGYTQTNAHTLAKSIMRHITEYPAVYKGNNGYGDIYEIVMNLTGENGKTANVLTSWIIENGKHTPRMTNAYVTKKRSRR